MKTLIATLLLTAAFVNAGFSNDGQYVEAMQKNIQALYSAKTPETVQNAVNAFERIGSAEKTRWEPFYYTSFGYIRMAAMEPDGGKKDALLDLAKASIVKALALKKDDSEIIAMDGFITMVRITVDPATRGPQYAGLAMQTYQTALTLNPNNPRALALLAKMQFGTAQFFNQAPTDACASAAKAMTKFADDVSDNALAPRWGREMTQDLLKNCQ
jgi:hypothetical protein